MNTTSKLPLALLSLFTLAAVAAPSMSSHAKGSPAATIDARWSRALRAFDRSLADNDSYLRADGARATARQAFDYGTDVSVCRTDANGADTCVGILDAQDPICHSTGCQCTWTACNDFATTCAEHGFNQTTCTISVNEGGYPIGLGCGCHAAPTEP